MRVRYINFNNTENKENIIVGNTVKLNLLDKIYLWIKKLFKIKIYTEFHSRSVALDAILFGFYDGHMHVLIEKRSETMMDHPAEWCVPCGYLDWNETAWDGLIREVYEETSLYIPDYDEQIVFDNMRQPFYVNSDPKSNRQNVALNYYIVFGFEDGLPSIEKFKNSEIAELKWIHIGDVPKYKLIFSHDKRIEMALKHYKNYFDLIEIN